MAVVANVQEQLTEQQAKAQDLGYQIGQAREKLGLSIEEVAEGIRIRKAHIVAIEQGALERLPGEPYTRSYMKRTIEFLQLDAEALLAEYDQSATPGQRKLLALPEIFSHETHASGGFALMGVALVILFVVLWNIAHPIVRAPLVMPFDSLNTQIAGPLPHRCEGTQGSYPPCRFENLALWYQPIKPNHHIFAVHKDTP